MQSRVVFREPLPANGLLQCKPEHGVPCGRSRVTAVLRPCRRRRAVADRSDRSSHARSFFNGVPPMPRRRISWAGDVGTRLDVAADDPSEPPPQCSVRGWASPAGSQRHRAEVVEGDRLRPVMSALTNFNQQAGHRLSAWRLVPETVRVSCRRRPRKRGRGPTSTREAPRLSATLDSPCTAPRYPRGGNWDHP